MTAEQREPEVMRQANIEIFVCCDIHRLTDWLTVIAGPITLDETMGEALFYKTRFGTVIMTPGMANGRFVSVYFGDSTPWDTDVDCARRAAAELGCIVRCDPGPQFPDVHPSSDTFLEIDRGQETRIVWCTDEDDADGGGDDANRR